jgi:uncharacterized protein YjbI with pentapeptide repeats
MALVGCGGSSNPNTAAQSASVAHKAAVHEHELSANPDVRALPYQTVILELEHSASTPHELDTGYAGVDIIPYEFPRTETYQFCMNDDNGEAHYMTLVDSNGAEVLRVTADAGCVTQTITAGHYEKRFYHSGAGTADSQRNIIFITPRFASTRAASASAREASASSADVSITMSSGSCIGCDLSGSTMDNIDMSGFTLKESDFHGASLNNVTMLGAHLEGADFSAASMQGADLSGAWVNGTNFTSTDLRDAVFTLARMGVYQEPLRIASNPSAFTFDNHKVVVVRGSDSNLWMKFSTDGYSWSPWDKLAENIQGDPSIFAITDGSHYTLNVFFKDADGYLKRVYCDHTNTNYSPNACWHPQWSIKVNVHDESGSPIRINASPSTAFNIGTLLYYTDQDDFIYGIWKHDDYLHTPWRGPYPGSMRTMSRVSIANEQQCFQDGGVNRSQHTWFYYWGVDGNLKYNTTSGASLGVRDTGIRIHSAPAAGSKGVFYRCSNGTLCWAEKDICSGSWTEYSTDISIASAPAVTQCDDSITGSCAFYHIFYRGADGDLWVYGQNVVSRGSYSGPFNLGHPGGSSGVTSLTDFANADLRGARFDAVPRMPRDLITRIDVSNARISAETFARDQWRYLNMTDVTVEGSYSLRGVDLSYGIYSGMVLSGIDMSSAKLDSAYLHGAVMNAVNLTDAILRGAYLSGADLSHANLTRANLTSAILEQVNGHGRAVLSNAYMPDAILDNIRADGAIFSGVNLYGSRASLAGAVLSNTRFANAVLGTLDLSLATITGADFTGANLVNANFYSVDARSVNLANANLEGADFTYAILNGAVLDGASIAFNSGTMYVDVIDENHQLIENQPFAYGPTLINATTATDRDTICPDGVFGPCNTIASLTAPRPAAPPECVPDPQNNLWCDW